MSGSGGRPTVDLRVVLHALDRTGPSMLALAHLRWLASQRPDRSIEVVAFRGGPLAGELAVHGDVHVVLDDHEAWDVSAPDPRRESELEARLSALGPAGANLLVSVAAGQALPLLPATIGPVAVWIVEVGEDLHWLDAPLGWSDRRVTWFAGSEASRHEVDGHPVVSGPVAVVPEFVADPRVVPEAEVAEVRRRLGVDEGSLLVLGAGIATHRKGIDLFAEVAMTSARRGRPARFHWVGGVDDPLYPLIAAEAARVASAHLSLQPPVADLAPLIAAADVFLHPARLDAFPLVCLHAAAQQTPVVAFTTSGGVAEMFGGALLGAPYPDVEALAALLDDLADPGHRAAVAHAQRRQVDRFLASAAAPELDRAIASIGGER